MSETQSDKPADRVSACAACVAAPILPTGSGRLFLWPPIAHAGAKLARVAGQLGLPCERRTGCVVIGLAGDGTEDLIGQLSQGVTYQERAGTRALFMPGDTEPGFADYGRIADLGTIAALGRVDWLLKLLDEGRLSAHFQPIHRADGTGVLANEALVRGVEPDGTLVPAGPLFAAARAAGQLFRLDLAARLAAVEAFAASGARGGLFINFTPTAIYDPATCLRSTFARIAELGLDPARIVFEVIESDQVEDAGHLLDVLLRYRQAGFKVALDDIGSGYSSLNLLHRLRPDYVKLDMHLVQGVATDPYKAILAGKLLEASRAMGIQTVCEGIEDQADLAWARAAGADYVQGYLLGRPAGMPA